MTYYNEHDPKAAAWLRELISVGAIPPGDVDTRSIADVRADDLRAYGSCHFFAGIGGWAYALRLAGWPDDLPVWTGSCPCQPFSAAGKQRGTDDERHLWPEFARLIAECRPPTVFGEQVASKLGRDWLSGVRVDLEGMGYAVGSADLCAAGVGAPHIRQRLYWVADTESQHHWTRNTGERRRDESSNVCPACKRTTECVAAFDDGTQEYRCQSCGAYGLADLRGTRLEERSEQSAREERPAAERSGDAGGMDNPESDRGESGRELHREHDRQESGGGRWTYGMGYAMRGGQQESSQRDGGADGSALTASPRTDVDGSDDRIERMGDAMLHGSPSDPVGRSTCSRENQCGVFQPERPNSHWSRFDIIQCRDGKARRFEPGSFPLAYGIPGRVGLLRGYGNAIVPQVAAEFIRAFCEVVTNCWECKPEHQVETNKTLSKGDGQG